MKKLITIAAVGLTLAGCTTFRVEQTDESPGERKVISNIKGTAWFSSAQAITQLKTIQTDKTQSTGFSSLNQTGPTNTVDMINALTGFLNALRPAP